MAGPGPSFPGEPPSRRLGTGPSAARTAKVQQVQLAIAVALAVVILATLLYLWRRPGADDVGATPPSASVAEPVTTIVRTPVAPPARPPETVKVGAVQHLDCGASPRQRAGDVGLCDALPFFEQSLTRAIADADCGVKATKEEGTINFVMVVDFRGREVRMYPGQSGSFRGKQAKAAVECVRRKIPPPQWDAIPHSFRWYLLSVMATYPATQGDDGLPSFQ